MRAMCLVLATSVGCYHGRVTVARADLAAAAGPLRADGQAVVRALDHVAPQDTEASTTTVRVDAPVVASFHPVRGATMVPRTLPVKDLLAGCPDGSFADDAATHAAHPACALLTVDPRIEVARRTFVRTDVVWSVVGLAVGAGAVGCAVACDDGVARTASYGVLAVGALVVVGGLVAIAVLSRVD